jgi:tRNA(Ile)-lysidine synthase
MTPGLMVSLEPLPRQLLVGVSGGLDSVALLHALVESGRRPLVLHFDHRWRPDSALDAAFVRILAKKYGLKFVAGKAGPRGKKTENSARQARYAFFAREAKRLRCRDLVLAHQADDQVETLLMQLLRGSGSNLGGMRLQTAYEELRVWRPWLGIWRSELKPYVRRHGLSWREDETNRRTDYLRNRIRLKVLPYLRRQISPAVDHNVWRAAEILGAERDYLDQLVKIPGKTKTLSIKEMKSEVVPLIRRKILAWLKAQNVVDVSFEDVEAVRGLLEKAVPAKVNVSQGRHVRRRAGVLFVEEK